MLKKPTSLPSFSQQSMSKKAKRKSRLQQLILEQKADRYGDWLLTRLRPISQKTTRLVDDQGNSAKKKVAK